MQGRQIAGERIRCIAAIIDRLNKSDIAKSGTEKSTENVSDGPLTIVTTIDGISDMLLPVDRFKRAVINLKKGDILDVEDMAKKLTAMGFERFGMVMLRIKLWSSLDLVFHHLVLISELA